MQREQNFVDFDNKNLEPYREAMPLNPELWPMAYHSGADPDDFVDAVIRIGWGIDSDNAKARNARVIEAPTNRMLPIPNAGLVKVAGADTVFGVPALRLFNNPVANQLVYSYVQQALRDSDFAVVNDWTLRENKDLLDQARAYGVGEEKFFSTLQRWGGLEVGRYIGSYARTDRELRIVVPPHLRSTVSRLGLDQNWSFKISMKDKNPPLQHLQLLAMSIRLD